MDETVDTSDGSYAFLINEASLILMHQNEEYMATEDTSHYLSDVPDGEYVSGVNCSNWKVVVVKPVSVYNQAVNQLAIAFVITIIVTAIIAAVMVAVFSNSITKPIIAMQEEIGKLAVGTLNQNKDSIVDKFTSISSETEELTASSHDIYSKVENQNGEINNIGTAIDELDKVVEQLNHIVAEFQM